MTQSDACLIAAGGGSPMPSDALQGAIKEAGISAIPPGTRRALKVWLMIVHLQLQNRRCIYCDVPMKTDGRLSECPTLDHLTPVSRMGSTSLENTAAACFACNQDKGHLTKEEYLAVLAVRGGDS